VVRFPAILASVFLISCSAGLIVSSSLFSLTLRRSSSVIVPYKDNFTGSRLSLALVASRFFILFYEK